MLSQVRKCRAAGCRKSAGFNYLEAGAKADYCQDHRLEGMAPLRARQCEVGGHSHRRCIYKYRHFCHYFFFFFVFAFLPFFLPCMRRITLINKYHHVLSLVLCRFFFVSFFVRAASRLATYLAVGALRSSPGKKKNGFGGCPRIIWGALRAHFSLFLSLFLDPK